MKKYRILAFGLTTLGVSLLVGMVGCSTFPAYRGGSPVQRSVYYHPYDYYYYPNISVYYRISTGHYYYRDGNRWRHAKVLPTRFFLNERNRVLISVRSDKPYLRNSEHKVRYATTRHAPRTTNTYDNKHNQAERKNNKRRHNNYRRR